MPFSCGGVCVPLAVGLGAIVVSSAALYYLRYKRKLIPKLKPVETDSSQKQHVTQNPHTGLFTKENLLKKMVPRQNKMVFVINRPLLMNKQNLFLTVSTACLRCYEVASKTKSCDSSMKSWIRSGQMKVVVKGQNSLELAEVSNKARELNLPCVVLKASDVKCLIKNDSKSDDLLVACIIGPVQNVDSITGHFKLL